MDIKEFKKLESKVKKPNFEKDFKSLNIILRVLSIFGNIASIFLASFFVTELLSVAIDNKIIYWGIAIVSLIGLELTKREIFHRFSRDFIRSKNIFKQSVLPMLIFTLILISMSFYSSLSGAQKFSSKTTLIEKETTTKVEIYKDSINKKYSDKINILETQNQILFDENTKLNNEARDLPSNWVTAKGKIRKNIKDNNSQIDKNDSKIKELKKERDNIIDKYKFEIESKSDKEKNKNKNDSKIFIIVSTLIEFLILIGIYFNNIYNFRTYRDTKKRLLTDDNYRMYHEYLEIIDTLFLNRGERDKIPDIDLMINLLIMNKVYLSKDQVENALKLFDALKIIETNDNHTYLIIDIEESKEIIKRHFNI